MLLLLHAIGLSFASGVVINEVVINPDGEDEDQEWIELHNASDEDVDVSGWTIRWGTTDFSTESVLGPVVLSAGEYALIGSDMVGAEMLVRLSLGNASSNSDGIQLVDSDGVIVDTLIYGSPNSDEWIDDSGFVATSMAPVAGSGKAIARAVDGVDSDVSGVDFIVSDMPTPASSNAFVIDDPTDPEDDSGMMMADCPGTDAVKINELLVNPEGADGGKEWVELYNSGDATINLDGWHVQKGTSSYSTFITFSSTVSMAPDSHLLIGGEEVVEADIVASISMGNASGGSDAVRLLDCTGAVADTVVYGSPNDDGWEDDSGAVADSLAPKPGDNVALARIQDGYDTEESGVDFVQAEVATPGESNPNIEPVECAWGAKTVKINEFMPDPEGSDADIEWVELYNTAEAAVSVEGWTLNWGKNGTYTGSVVFAVGTEIAPGGIMLVGGAYVGGVDVIAPLDMGNAGSNSDGLQLVDCEGVVQDTVIYGSPNDEEWVDDSGEVATSMADGPGSGQSLARVNDGVDTDRSAEDFARTDEPTPGESNPETEPVVCVPGENGVKINEILPNPAGDDVEGEFIELINTTSETVSIAGWGIAAGTSSWPAVASFTFPGSATIAAGAYAVVGGLGVDEADFYTDGDNKFSLGNGSKNPDGVRLVDCTGTVQDTVLYGDPVDPVEDFELDDDAGAASMGTMPGENFSLGRSPDGVDTDNNEDDLLTNMPPSPGEPNKVGGSGGSDASAGCGCGKDGPEDPDAPAPEASGLAGFAAAFSLFIALRRREE